MRVLVLDNYDSVAWNLVQALGALGAEVLVRRNDSLSAAEAMSLGAAAIVLSPGPCAPEQAGICVGLVRAAAARAMPLLGVCLGHQAIGAAFGGRVVRGARPVHGKTGVVRHDGRCVYAGLPESFAAMRYHSLVVAEPLPQELLATAHADDGALMGLRHRSLPIEGVQFHPESYLTPQGPALLSNFLETARAAML